MAELPPYRDTGEEPDRGSSPSTPLWVKVLVIIIAIILVLLIIISHLTGSIGPGAH